ncbi:uncharacterized protein LOC131438255 isoform X2 [Malaya genurostris]|nr:uncharacterized protein LOC131438255 isoform X2 [Malaya genurostris]XP_058464115.1 uncharacterized protein LOC131438255 isoform X2 [Malaya genurostris]XP_058464116.1 uncharacterized protein LOC131438255 isoform X2 [Malaya genurostris]
MVQLDGKHTGKYLRSQILEILKDYNIGIENVFSITCDNGANMLSTVKDLQKTFPNNLIMESENADGLEEDQEESNILSNILNAFKNSVNLITCAVHTMQLSVTDVTKSKDTEIREITKVAKACRKMSYKNDFGNGSHVLPPLYAKTRWGGAFLMIQHFSKNFSFYVEMGKKHSELDLSKNWQFIHDFTEAFEPVFSATTKIQEKHVGLSDFYLAWLDTIRKVNLVSNPLAVELSNTLTTRLNTLKENMPLKSALLLDPRFNFHKSNVFTLNERVEIRQFIKTTHKKLCDISSRINETPLSDSPNNNTNAGEEDELDDFLTDMFGGALSAASSSTSQKECSLEEQLIMLDVSPRQPHSLDVWKYWTDRRLTHPELYDIATLIYTIPSNQVSIERAFSALALLLTSERSAFNNDTLQNIFIARVNKPILHSSPEQEESLSETINLKSEKSSDSS